MQGVPDPVYANGDICKTIIKFEDQDAGQSYSADADRPVAARCADPAILRFSPAVSPTLPWPWHRPCGHRCSFVVVRMLHNETMRAHTRVGLFSTQFTVDSRKSGQISLFLFLSNSPWYDCITGFAFS